MNFESMDPDYLRRNVASAAKIFNDYGDFIKKVIRSQIQDEDQVEDLFQDFFLTLISNPLPEDIQSIEAYLHKRINNYIVNTARLRGKYLSCMNEYAKCYNNPNNLKIPEKVVMETEEVKRIIELIEKKLPITEAQAVRFQYREGLNAKETAEKMCVKNKTIRGYVSDGLNRIRRLLKDIETRSTE